MKNTTLTIACSSLIFSTTSFANTDAEVPYTPQGTSSSYITGNVQLHDRKDFNGSDVTSTIEAGHTFETGTTLFVEFDGIQLGKTSEENGDDYYSNSAYTTLGIEQAYDINDNLWVAAGYQHMLHDGDTIQYRPLVKIGYNFDNGVSLSNRVRYHIADGADGVDNDDALRFDNRISYQLPNHPIEVAYNNIYVKNDADNLDNAWEHEIRATWTREGVQPYIEYRNQDDAAEYNSGHNNNVLVLGASYAF